MKMTFSWCCLFSFFVIFKRFQPVYVYLWEMKFWIFFGEIFSEFCQEVGFQVDFSTSRKRTKLLLVMWDSIEITLRVLANAFFWLYGGVFDFAVWTERTKENTCFAFLIKHHAFWGIKKFAIFRISFLTSSTDALERVAHSGSVSR